VAFDLPTVRAQFPALRRRVHGRPLVWLDAASTSQKPQVVLDAVLHAMEGAANVHRGVHTLSVEATSAFEATRDAVATLLGGVSRDEVVFVRGTTEAVNLVAQTLGRARVGPGDRVLVTQLEHHSNLVPWQRLCVERGATLETVPLDDRGQVDPGAFAALLSTRTKLVALAHASNALGTVLPVRAIADLAHAVGALVFVDGAQAIAHLSIDVAALDCDFYAFSSHKLYGPTGVGVLWGRRALLDAMPPWQTGGDMVAEVERTSATWRDPPHRFEAGTPDVVGVIGLGAAVDWFQALGPAEIAAHDQRLLRHAHGRLREVPGLRFIGEADDRIGLVSFVMDDVHAHDLGTALDREGVALRTGHHCAQPVMERFGVSATARASFSAFTTTDELDLLAEALTRARRSLGLTR
jgi:cysteine desulfurase/selenocysteine lyase